MIFNRVLNEAFGLDYDHFVIKYFFLSSMSMFRRFELIWFLFLIISFVFLYLFANAAMLEVTFNAKTYLQYLYCPRVR